MIFMGFLSYRNSEATIKRISMNYASDILQMIELRFSDYISNLTIISQDLLYDKGIYSALTSRNTDDPLVSYENESEISNTIKKIILSRPEIQSIAIISRDGQFYYSDDNALRGGIRELLPYQEVLDKARAYGGKPCWYMDSQEGVVQNIFLSRIIYHQDTFEEIGLQVILLRKDFIETVYQGLTKSMENIIILSAEHQLIASRNAGDGMLPDIASFGSLEREKDSRIDQTLDAMISYTTVMNTGWKVITYVPLPELFRDAYALRRNIILLCVVTAILLSVLNLAIAMSFVNPINKLVKGMKMVQEDNQAVQIDDDRQDEMGFLNKTFNEMSREINHLVTWVYREQITRKDAELKALQSQINPHFLFNTLESINWMARLNNVPEISETVTDLSDLMEASIGRDDRLITVKEEFGYSDKYISLLKRRFEDKIQYRSSIQQEAEEVKIPRLLIQPLVENAVFHGIERLRGKGEISLDASIVEGSLVITVMDSGPGIDDEGLKDLNSKLSMGNDEYFKTLTSQEKKSIGIENVNRRIKLFYGDSYGLKIESEQGRYTRVVVRLPVDTEHAEGYYVQGHDHR
ncbi:MAG: sensor histidine kinase [Thermoclostridium sp.]|nr:sensor histidine kinase [Thermoclostridium sp.]